jgi:uncharacterized protein (TIGR02145 family)
MKNITILLVFLMLATWDVTAQESIANTRFYEGVVAEEVTGDLDKALSIYQDLFKTNKSDRILAAKCLYHIGLTYEKKGSDKAIGYYSEVIEKYPDQSDLAELARGRIAKLKDTNTFIDPRDGHKYRWVKIGSQIWMAENLAYMPHVNPPKKQEDGIWVYDYDGEDVAEAKATENYQKYGCLYDWAMAMNIDTKYLEQPWNGNSEMHQGICPPGWHLPTDGEWKTLEKSLGMTDSLADVEDDVRAGDYSFAMENSQVKHFLPIGKYLKSSTGWYQESNGDNSSGLSMFAAGIRNGLPLRGGSLGRYYRDFDQLGYRASFWTASEGMDTIWNFNPRSFTLVPSVFRRSLYTHSPDVERINYGGLQVGLSARCVKDDSDLPIVNNSTVLLKKEKIIPSPTISEKIPFEKSISLKLNSMFSEPPASPQSIFGYSIFPDDDRIIFSRNNTNKIVALDLKTNDTLWTLISEQIHLGAVVESKNNLIFRSLKDLTAIKKADGKVAWKIDSNDFELLYSTVANEILYGQGKDGLLAINVNTGERIWAHTNITGGHSKSTIVNDTLFCTVVPNRKAGTQPRNSIDMLHPVVEAIDAKTGKLIWEFQFYGFYWHCAYQNGLVMIRGISSIAGPYLIAVNAKSGAKEWATYLGTTGSNEPIAVGDSSLFILSANNRKPDELFSLDFNGKIKWNKTLTKINRDLNQYPVLYDNKVFYLMGDVANFRPINSKLFAVDAISGSTIYTFDLKSEPASFPVFKNNKMYIGCKDGLYIYDYPKID